MSKLQVPGVRYRGRPNKGSSSTLPPRIKSDPLGLAGVDGGSLGIQRASSHSSITSNSSTTSDGSITSRVLSCAASLGETKTLSFLLEDALALHKRLEAISTELGFERMPPIPDPLQRRGLLFLGQDSYGIGRPRSSVLPTPGGENRSEFSGGIGEARSKSWSALSGVSKGHHPSPSNRSTAVSLGNRDGPGRSWLTVSSSGGPGSKHVATNGGSQREHWSSVFNDSPSSLVSTGSSGFGDCWSASSGSSKHWSLASSSSTASDDISGACMHIVCMYAYVHRYQGTYMYVCVGLCEGCTVTC